MGTWRRKTAPLCRKEPVARAGQREPTGFRQCGCFSLFSSDAFFEGVIR